MAKTKAVSTKDDSSFLKNALLSVEKTFLTNLEHKSKTNTHNGSHGDSTEDVWIELLKEYLPARYEVAKAFAIDHKGNTTKQLDCLIYDAYYTPKLFGGDKNLYVPAEAVYATFEIKQEVNPRYLKDAAEKVGSLRKLIRTSVPLTGAYGENLKKTPMPILGGLLAMKTEWKDGFGKSFRKNNIYSGNQKLDLILTAESGFYDDLNSSKEIVSGEGSLIIGLFHLIKALRKMNSVTPVDWDEYEKILK